MFHQVKNFKDQDYEALRKDCLNSGMLFTDPSFPPDNSSLSLRDNALMCIEWKRPQDICCDPKLMLEDDPEGAYFPQGALGKCSFLTACAAIAEEPKLLKKVVFGPQNHGFGDDYAGIFHFHIYHFGEWLDVVVDDFLPTRNDTLIHVSSPSRNEFWSALLEKAYAKVHGSYESMYDIEARDILVDLFGGVAEDIDLAEYKNDLQNKEQLLKIMTEAHENHSLMSASMANNKGSLEAETKEGIITGQGYSIINVKTIKLGEELKIFFKKDTLQLVCLRNLWGGNRWRGPWCDSSHEWLAVSDKEKEEMGMEIKRDGEFWMTFDDFCKHFTHVDACHMINQSVFSSSKTWQESIQVGQWVKPKRCGGCANHESFLENPLYLIDIDSDEEEIMISLEQDRTTFEDKVVENANIGLCIMKAEGDSNHRFHHRQDAIKQSSYCAARSSFLRVKLKRGHYCIIPSTLEPGVEKRFFLRTHCGKDIRLRCAIDPKE